LPGSLDRCASPDDWLRREIETAIDYERNIVPLMFAGFSFSQNQKLLTDKLENLSRYNAIPIYAEYFDEAMARLHTRFLSKPLAAVLHPTPTADEPLVQERIREAQAAPQVTQQELTAADYYNRAATHGNLDDMLRDYNEAIRINPDFAQAYDRRGMVKRELGQLEEAVADFTRSIDLGNPQLYVLYEDRGIAYAQMRELQAAEADFTRSLEHGNPATARVLNNRGFVRVRKSDYANAMKDFNSVIAVEPKNAHAHSGRAWTHYMLEQYEQALADANFTLERTHSRDLRAATLHTRGRAYLALGDCTAALTDLAEAQKLNPDDGRITEAIQMAHDQCDS
jgi:tetratricopeptide (TPR) repeat protein